MPDDDGDDRIGPLLRDGERAVDDVRVGGDRVVLTTRRLLVVRDRGRSGSGDGDVRAVDRANVGTVRTRTASDRGGLLLAAQWAGLGAFLLAAWRIVPFEGLVRPIEPPGVGFEGLFAAVNAVVRLVGLLDEAFLAAGGLALAWAGLRIVRYLLGRRRVLEVTVTGGEPIDLPADADGDAVDRLRRLVESAASATGADARRD